MTIGANEPFDGVWLRLTATEPGTCRIAADQRAVDTGRCTPAISARSPAIVEGASLAYFSLRRLDDAGDQRRWELGAIGHGPDGHHLAERLSEVIRAWDENSTVQPELTAYPIDTPYERTAALVINKPCVRIMILA